MKAAWIGRAQCFITVRCVRAEEGRKPKEKTFSNKKQKFLNRKWKNAFSIAVGGLKMVLSFALPKSSRMSGYCEEALARFGSCI